FALVKEKFPQAVITIVGDGSDARRLQKLVHELGLSDVNFTGRVEREQILHLLDQADIFLNCSLVDNMPVAIIEAFAVGLPVVTSNAGGIPYFVSDGENGLVREMKDHRALAEAVIEVASNDDLRARLIAGGKATAAKCRWEAVKWEWVTLYRDLIT
ncbi:MAG: glycosyltransferase family 4 protein, partial [candidate division Zixibacteria bacterium]|nr:glycosyltransferase family 4 protein [candidate division Zixibacteria bacterium]